MDATTGKILWNGTLGGIPYSSPAVANGVVYIASQKDRKLYAFDADRCGTMSCQPLWVSAPADSSVWASPAVANGVAYVGSVNGTLYAFDTNACKGNLSCQPLWSAPASGSNFVSPTVVEGVVYIPGAGELYAFDATTGKPLWKGVTNCCAKFWVSSPAVAGGVVYVGSGNGGGNAADRRLYAFDAIGCNGHFNCPPLWTSIQTGNDIESSPAVANGVVYVGSDDNKLYAFDTSACKYNMNCAPLWSFATGGGVSTPSVANGMVYVGSSDFKLYAFGLPACSSSITC